MVTVEAKMTRREFVTDKERREAAERLYRYCIKCEPYFFVWPRTTGGCNADLLMFIEPYLPPPPRPADDAPCTEENMLAAGMISYRDGVYESPQSKVRNYWGDSAWYGCNGRGYDSIQIPAPATIGDLRTLCRLLGDPLPEGDQ